MKNIREIKKRGEVYQIREFWKTSARKKVVFPVLCSALIKYKRYQFNFKLYSPAFLFFRFSRT